MRLCTLFLLSVSLLLGAAASASAKSYCVGMAGCDDDSAGANLQSALDKASNNPGPDEVRIVNGAVLTTSGFQYDSSDPVHITGAGGRSSGALGTQLSDSSGNMNPANHTVLKVIGSSDSTIAHLAVVLPSGTGTPNTGIETTGTIDDVAVLPPQGGSVGPIGVRLDADGALVDSDVLFAVTGGTGVTTAFPRTIVRDSRIEASTGVLAFPGASLSLDRLRVEFSGTAVHAAGSAVTLDDSLLVNRSDALVSRTALIAESGSGPDASLSADHVTLIGTTDTGAVALVAFATGNAAARVSFRNGVISQYGSVFNRQATGMGAASITTDYSDYSGGVQQDAGPGAITETNHLSQAPGFLGPQDYHLAPGSPLVDAGDPVGLTASESTTDVSGAPRIVDGDGDCSARRDIGAYEFQPGPRAPHAVAAASPAQSVTNQQVSFDASGSCDPDGDALTYDWTFDDGGGAPGASLQRSFAASGVHFGTVTVTDSSGRSSSATASVFVAEPSPPGPIPAFAGVAIAKQKLRVSRKRVATVRVKCPAATAGSCAGTLKLAGKSKAFSIKPGATGKVAVKLSKATVKKLRKNGRLNLTATATAHDANGSSKKTTRKITLLRPR